MKNLSGMWLICGLINAGSVLAQLEKEKSDFYEEPAAIFSVAVGVTIVGPLGLGWNLQEQYQRNQPQ